MRAVTENAANTDRKQRFRAVATVSQGYDSNACAAIAATLGYREALTLITKDPAPGQANDGGKEVGRSLGLSVTEYGRSDYHNLHNCVEAEFAASCPYPGGTPLAIAAQQLEGAIALMGDRGDQTWGVAETYNLPDLMCPESVSTPGTSYTEYRLRIGYLHFSVPYIGATHRQELQRIAESDEMKAWSVPGEYNRPIPRRLVEESGVRRELFGRTKQAGASILALTQESAADFEAYYESQPIPDWFREVKRYRLKELPSDLLALLYRMSATRLQGKRMRLYKLLLPITMLTPRKKRGAEAFGGSQQLRRLSCSKYLYLYHWGFERIKGRYET